MVGNSSVLVILHRGRIYLDSDKESSEQIKK
jgi:hypothetical protein